MGIGSLLLAFVSGISCDSPWDSSSTFLQSHEWCQAMAVESMRLLEPRPGRWCICHRESAQLVVVGWQCEVSGHWFCWLHWGTLGGLWFYSGTQRGLCGSWSRTISGTFDGLRRSSVSSFVVSNYPRILCFSLLFEHTCGLIMAETDTIDQLWLHTLWWRFFWSSQFVMFSLMSVLLLLWVDLIMWYPNPAFCSLPGHCHCFSPIRSPPLWGVKVGVIVMIWSVHLVSMWWTVSLTSIWFCSPQEKMNSSLTGQKIEYKIYGWILCVIFWSVYFQSGDRSRPQSVFWWTLGAWSRDLVEV